MRHLIILASVLACIAAWAMQVEAVTFADGQVHVIDASNSFPFDTVVVEDDPITGAVTTVRVVDGGEVNGIIAHQSSVVEMLGGRAVGSGGDEGITMNDSSFLSMSGGLAETINYSSSATSELFGTAEVSVNGITVSSGRLNISGDAMIPGDSAIQGGVVNIYDGESDRWNVFAGGTILVSGGNHSQVSTAEGGNVEISGGTIRQVGGTGGGAGSILISGGNIENVLSGLSGSSEIIGGSITEGLFATGTSTMALFGTGFNFAFGDIVPTTGTLVGTLSDGTPIDVEFSRATTAIMTLVASEPAPSIEAVKTDLLFIDNDADERVDPGDTLRYSIVLSNSGTASATDSVFMDPPDPNSSLVVGSVTTTQGTVVSGNGPSDSSVEVQIGTLSQGGGSVEVTFDVVINDPFPPSILMIANQGEISGANFDPVQTDDPTTNAFPDPTLTEVANTQLDICERELDQCLNNPPIPDEDGDLEADQTDKCPNTPAGAVVDSDGCSLWQFCTAIDTSSYHGRRICKKSDWNNDEPLKIEGDCKAVRLGKGPSNYQCVPR